MTFTMVHRHADIEMSTDHTTQHLARLTSWMGLGAPAYLARQTRRVNMR